MTEDGSSGFAWKDRARDRIPRGEKHKQKGNAGEKKRGFGKEMETSTSSLHPQTAARESLSSGVARIAPLPHYFFFTSAVFPPQAPRPLSPPPTDILSS